MSADLSNAVAAAIAADAEFEAALKAEGFKSRWDRQRWEGSDSLQVAYRNKIDADYAMHLAFAATRGE